MPLEGNVDLSGLYPGLTPEELEKVHLWYQQYLGIIFRISERQAKDVPPEAVAEPVKVS